MSGVRNDILNGWKEIAGYVGRDIRTVERWEKQRGLPVRRVPGAGRATVYARVAELERWLASTPPAEIEKSAADPVVPIAEPVASFGSGEAMDEEISIAGPLTAAPDGAFAAVLPSSVTPEQDLQGTPWWKRPVLAATGVAVSLVLLGAVFLFQRHDRNAAAAVRLEHEEPSSAAMGRRPSPVPGVEDLYLRGSYFYERRTPAALKQARESFNEAIARDPKYAPAYAGLASTYNLLREYSEMPDAEAYPFARNAAMRAVQLDPSLAGAHVSLGFVDYFWYLDVPGAEREFKTAIALEPNLAQAHHWYGSVLTHEGRYPEALRELELAQHLQPSSPAILTNRALAVGLAGHPEQARAMLSDLLNTEGDDRALVTAHSVMAVVSLVEPRDLKEFFRQSRRVAEVHNDKEQQEWVDAGMSAYQRGGEPAVWETLLAREMKRHPTTQAPTFRKTQYETELGRQDDAFADLNRLAERRDPALSGLSMDPLLRPLHGDPRFDQLRQKLGLVPETTASAYP